MTEEAISHYKKAIRAHSPNITTLELLWLLKGRMRKLFLITRWLLSSSLTSPKHITTLEMLWLLKKTEEISQTEEAISHYNGHGY